MGYKTEETGVAEQIEEYLKELQEKGAPLYFEHRSGAGGFNYKKGSPDFFIVYNGTHIELEAKASKGKQSTLQRKWQWKCETLWNIIYLCPHSFREFKTWFEEFIKKS